MPWRFFFGILILASGFGAFLEQLKLIPAGSMNQLLVAWWPAAVVLLGLNQLFRRSAQPWAAMLIVGLGLWLLSVSLDRHPLESLLFLYTVLLVLFGLQLILPRRFRREDARSARGKTRIKHQLKEVLVFSGLQFHNLSQQFQGGRVVTLFGDYILDLHEAALAQQGAEVSCSAVFGSIIVRVPSNMAVAFSGTAALGALENLTEQIVWDEPGRPVLRVKAVAVCGTVRMVTAASLCQTV